MKSEGHFMIWTGKYHSHLLKLYSIFLENINDERYIDKDFYNRFVNLIYRKSSGYISQNL